MIEKELYDQSMSNVAFGFARHEVIYDINGKPSDYQFLEVNKSFEQLTGMAADFITGKTVKEVFPGIDEGAFNWIETFAKVTTTGNPAEFTLYFEQLNRWFIIQAFSSQPKVVSAIFTDITNIKKEVIQAHSQARMSKTESNEKIRNLIEAMPDMIFVMHRNGTILEIFGAIPERLIAPEHELIGTSIKDCFDSEEFRRHISIYKQCIEKNENGLIDFELTISGKRMFFESRVKPLDNERLLTIVRDKTEQKQLLERISDGFVAMDIDMNYIYVNETAGKMLGRSPKELIGKNYWTEFPEAKETPFGNAYLKALKSQETIIIEEYYEPWNRWFSNAIYPSSNGLSIIFQEITERKLAETTLKESEKRYAFLAESAIEMAALTTLGEIYTYTAVRLNQLLNGHSIVAVVENNNVTGTWKMKHLEGVAKNITEISKILGFDIRHLEGNISEKYKEKITSGKLEEIPFDFSGLFNNRLSDTIGKMVKKMLSIDKMYCIILKHSDHVFGNITFTTSTKTGKLNPELIEAFIIQVTNFVKKLKAEEELKLSEEKFAKAFHNSPNIIGLSDMNSGEYVEVNQSFFNIMEYSQDEIVGKKVKDLVKMEPTFRDKALAMLTEKGTVRNLETTLYSKNGKPIPVLLSADIIKINNKEYNFTTGVDLTELKKAEKLRNETESHFRAYVVNAPLGVFVADANGNYMEVNEEACRLTGYSQDELLKKNFLEVVAPKSIEIANAHFQEVITEGRAHGEIEAITKTGEKRWWSVVAAKISNDRFIGFHLDITERKLIDQSLLETQANLTAIVENTLDSIWSINTKYEITYINDVFASAFNATFGVVLKQGSNLLKSMPLAIQPIWKERYDRALSGERIVFEDAIEAHGSFIFIEVAANPIVRQGEVIGVSLFGRDVSERKKNEQTLYENEKRIESIFRSAPIGIGLLVDRVIFQANEWLCQMTGYSEHEVLNKSVRILYCSDDEFERVGKLIYEQIDKQDIGTLETKWKRKNGEEYDVLLRATPVNPNDLSAGVTFTTIDITEQKRAEEKIRRSNQQLESFLEISQNINKTWDQEKIIQLIVDNAIRIMGLKTGAVYLKDDEETIRLAATSPPLPENFPSRARLAVLKNHPHIEKALKTGKHVFLADAFSAKLTPEEEEIVRLRNLRSNLYIPILLREKPIGVLILTSSELMETFKDEDIHLLQGFANQAAHIMDNVNHFEELKKYADELKQQIKQRKEAEDELKKLSQAVEQSPASVEITDTNGIIEYINPKFTQVTGYTLEELKGLKPSILKSGYQPAALYKELWETISAGKEWRGELQNKKKNGELYWESVSISPIVNQDGTTTHYLAVKEDITERKVMEEQLVQQSYLKELLMEISSGFINIPLEHVDEAVNIALRKMGQFVNADRAYTFDYDWNRNICNNIYEWCAEGISPEIENLQGVPLDMMTDWVDVHKKGEAMYVADVFALLPNDGVRILLEPQGVKSVLSVPMMNEGKCIGFVGFDSVIKHHTYSDIELQLLKMFAQMLANVALRKHIFDQLLIAKEKAEESEKRYDLAITGSEQGIWDWDIKTNEVYFSQQWKKQIGYNENELENNFNTWVEHLHPDEKEACLNAISEYLNKPEEHFNLEFRFRHKDGSYRWINSKSSFLKNNKGIVTRMFGTHTDITERKLAEILLVETSERLNEVLENSIDASYKRNLINNKYEYLSPAFIKISGYSIDDFNNLPLEAVLEVMHPDDIIETEKIIAQALTDFSRKSHEIIYRFKHKDDGNFRWLHDKFIVIRDNQNQPIALIGSVSDITARKMIEEELIVAKEKAEESNRLKTAFLQNLSHEVRTPLNGIIGFSELLSEDDLTAEERKKFTEIIIERGFQLTSIINDILTISALETGQEELFEQKIDISQFLNNHLEAYKKNASAKGLQLKSNIRLLEQQTVVFGDRHKIGQILNNLFNNALKFTQQGSIELGCSLRENMLEFYVRDTGLGIEKVKQSLIFERFMQADDSIRRDFGGTGLGLSICKGFIDLMGGQIWVESEPNNGTTFYFTIPYKPVEIPSIDGGKATEFHLPGKQLTILVAEDEQSNYFVLELILNKLNCNVRHAINGIKAIEICREENIDLVLMDIKMPVLDGYNAALRIREFKPGLYIIAQSAHAAQSEIEHYKDAFDDYVTKPFNKEKIKDCLAKFLNK